MQNQTQKVVVANGGSYKFIELKDVLRIQADGSYTNIFLTNDEKICSSKNIGHYRGMLEDNGFFLCHKSHMININLISSYSKDGFITMQDGSSVPLARRRKEAFNKKVLLLFSPTYFTKYQVDSTKLIRLPSSSAGLRVGV